MPEIKAIETSYKGFRFRSRLEARWAVFFDNMGIEWKYEPEGYDINGTYYLPDFWLPKTQTWVEVKGDWSSVDREYWDMLFNAIEYGGCLPGVADSWGETRGLLLLSDIPEPCEDNPENRFNCRMIYHAILQHHKGVIASRSFFTSGGIYSIKDDVIDVFGGHGDLALRPSEITLKSYVGITAWNLDLSARKIWEAAMKSSAAYQVARAARFEHGETP